MHWESYLICFVWHWLLIMNIAALHWQDNWLGLKSDTLWTEGEIFEDLHICSVQASSGVTADIILVMMCPLHAFLLYHVELWDSNDVFTYIWSYSTIIYIILLLHLYICIVLSQKASGYWIWLLKKNYQVWKGE